MTHLKGLSAPYMRVVGKCNNGATGLWIADDVGIGLHTTQTMDLVYDPDSYQSFDHRLRYHQQPYPHQPYPHQPYPSQPYPHQSLIDAVQPMFRLCQSALTNHGGPVRQTCTVSTHGVS